MGGARGFKPMKDGYSLLVPPGYGSWLVMYMKKVYFTLSLNFIPGSTTTLVLACHFSQKSAYLFLYVMHSCVYFILLKLFYLINVMHLVTNLMRLNLFFKWVKCDHYNFYLFILYNVTDDLIYNFKLFKIIKAQ